MTDPNIHVSERFWKKVDRRAPSACWEWLGGKNSHGYGAFYYRKLEGAHRAAYMLATGPIPAGLCVLHRCDNPSCVNPSHLFLGTAKDNAQDKVRKGRTFIRKGEDVPTSKLKEEDVKLIRIWYALGYLQRQIAEAFDVQQPMISRILNRTHWKHL